MHSNIQTFHQFRVEITDKMLKNFFKNIFGGTVSELAAGKGLPYTLVYNLVHRRIHSLSPKDYKIIFGEEPPQQKQNRVDGEFFRGMVRLWLSLNDGATEADLYREFYQDKNFVKVDYRIFTGDIKTIETRLEKIMEGKFLAQGFDRTEIGKWIEELDRMNDEERVPYDEIRPVLGYLEVTLGVNPSRILNQWLVRYESGELKTVPNRVYDYALKLRRRTEEAVNYGSRFEMEKLREEIYGKRAGLTLYSEVLGELKFLKKYVGRSPNRYLGRSISVYKKSKLKRIASWRAQKIKDDCNDYIRHQPELALSSVPKSYSKMIIKELLSVLKSYLTRKIIEDESGTYEREILTPKSYGMEEYEKKEHGFTSMEKVAYALGMSKKAFDLLVIENCDLFRRIGIYDQKWYLPNLYLKEILEKEDFDLIISKYEALANDGENHPPLKRDCRVVPSSRDSDSAELVAGSQ